MDIPTIDTATIGDVFRLNTPLNINGEQFNHVMVIGVGDGNASLVRAFDPNNPSRNDLGFFGTRPKTMWNLTPANTAFVDNYPYSKITDKGRYIFPVWSPGLRDDPSFHARGGRTKRRSGRSGRSRRGRSIRKRVRIRSNKKR